MYTFFTLIRTLYFVILYTIYISLAAPTSKTYAKHIATFIQSPSQVHQGDAIHFQTAQTWLPARSFVSYEHCWAAPCSRWLGSTWVAEFSRNEGMGWRCEHNNNFFWVTKLNKKANTLSLTMKWRQKMLGWSRFFLLKFIHLFEKDVGEWFLFLGIFNSLVQRFKLFVMIGSVGHDEVCIKSISQFMSNLCWVTLRQIYVQCILRNVHRVSAGLLFSLEKVRLCSGYVNDAVTPDAVSIYIQ